jgi:hypothetical protein
VNSSARLNPSFPGSLSGDSITTDLSESSGPIAQLDSDKSAFAASHLSLMPCRSRLWCCVTARAMG